MVQQVLSFPPPSDTVYSATKAYIMSFSNALYGEYRNTGIKITLLCPGATETEFSRKANIERTLLFKYAVMKPDKVVKIAYPKIIKGKRLIIREYIINFSFFSQK